MTLLDFLNLYPISGYILLACFGAIIGSFLNVVCYRLPEMMQREWREQCEMLLAEEAAAGGEASYESNAEKAGTAFNLMWPNSHCPSCKTAIKITDNIPILSFLMLRGKCRHCKASIPFSYLATEVVAAIICAGLFAIYGTSWLLIPAIIFGLSLLTLSVIDIKHQLLPDNITLPLLWLGLIININGAFVPLENAVIGAVAGYLSLWSIFWVFKLVTGKEGMGYGDFKLLAVLGAWLGWQALPLIILLSALVGAIFGISMVVFQKHDKQQPIPFGPYLAAAGFIMLLWGTEISRYYFDLTT